MVARQNEDGVVCPLRGQGERLVEVFLSFRSHDEGLFVSGGALWYLARSHDARPLCVCRQWCGYYSINLSQSRRGLCVSGGTMVSNCKYHPSRSRRGPV